jgi:hypothetical protein
MRLLMAIVVASLATGCTATALAATHPATTRATTQPRVLRMTDAFPVERFEGGGVEVSLTQRIQFTGGRELLFGQAEAYDENDDVVATSPVIVQDRGGVRTGVSVADPRLANGEWQFVGTGPRRGEAWGVLDDTLTSRGRAVLLVHTTDSGATWTVTPIDKPFGAAGEYDSFAMSRDGHGRLTIYVAGTRQRPRRAGFYHFRTTDGGATWSPSPEHERDDLTPADDADVDDPPPDATPPGQRV